MDEELDDYKLDSTFGSQPDHVIHTMYERPSNGIGLVKVEQKWHQRRELGKGGFGVVYLQGKMMGSKGPLRKFVKR